MDHLASFLIEQDVVAVAIAEAENMAEDGDGGSATRVGEATIEPVVGVLEALHEEVPEDRVKVVRNLAESLDSLFHGFGLCIGNMFSAQVGFQIFREMPLVGRHQVVMQGNSVRHEFNDA